MYDGPRADGQTRRHFRRPAKRNNKQEAIGILQARLETDAVAAARAFDDFSARPRPTVMSEALRQVIDVVWDAEGLKGPRGAPEKYIDLSYLHQATP